MPPTSEPARRAQALIRLEEFQAKLDPQNIFRSVAFRKLGRSALSDRLEAFGAFVRKLNGVPLLAPAAGGAPTP